MTTLEGDEPQASWVIRLAASARADVHAGWAHFARAAGESVADAWQEGLEAEIAHLARMPQARPVAEEDGLFRETVRKLLYRRAPGAPAYRVLFVLRRPAGESPTVYVLHIRHGAQAPLTADEAREAQDDEEPE